MTPNKKNTSTITDAISRTVLLSPKVIAYYKFKHNKTTF